jgi:hypothetical protein
MSDMRFKHVEKSRIKYDVDKITYTDRDGNLMGDVACNQSNEFIIPVKSCMPYYTDPPKTLEDLRGLLLKDKPVHKVWDGEIIYTTRKPLLVDTSLEELYNRMKTFDTVKLYLYSNKDGKVKVLHITYEKNKASAASPFRPRRRGSNSVKRRRKLGSKSKSRKRSPKPRRR